MTDYLAPLTPSAFPLTPSSLPFPQSPMPTLDLGSTAILSDPGSAQNSPRLSSLLTEFLGDISSSQPAVTRTAMEEYLFTIAASFENLAKDIAAPEVYLQRDLVVISDAGFGPAGPVTVPSNRSIVLSRPKGDHQQAFTAIWDADSKLSVRNAVALYQTVCNSLGIAGVSDLAYAIAAYNFCVKDTAVDNKALRHFYPRCTDRIKTLSSEQACKTALPHHFELPEGLEQLKDESAQHGRLFSLFSRAVENNRFAAHIDSGFGFYKICDSACTFFLFRNTPNSPWLCVANVPEEERNVRGEPIKPAATPTPKRKIAKSDSPSESDADAYQHEDEQDDEDDEDEESEEPKKSAKKAAPAASLSSSTKKRKSSSTSFRPPAGLSVILSADQVLAEPPERLRAQLGKIYEDTLRLVSAPGRRRGKLGCPPAAAPASVWELYYRCKGQTCSRQGVTDGQSAARSAYIAVHNKYKAALVDFASGKIASDVKLCKKKASNNNKKKQEADIFSVPPRTPATRIYNVDEELMAESIEEVDDNNNSKDNVPAVDAVMNDDAGADEQHQDKKARIPATPPPPPSIPASVRAVASPDINVDAVQRAYLKERDERRENAGGVYVIPEPEGFDAPQHELTVVTDRQGLVAKPVRFIYRPDANKPAFKTVMGRDLAVGELADEVDFILTSYGLFQDERDAVQDIIKGNGPRYEFSLAPVKGVAQPMVLQPFLGSFDDGTTPRFLRGDKLQPYIHDIAAIMATHGKSRDSVYELFEKRASKAQ